MSSRRMRMRRQMMRGGTAAEDAGGNEGSGIAPKAEGPHQPTNLQTLTGDLTKQIIAEAKKRKKPRYIDTSKLLRYHRA